MFIGVQSSFSGDANTFTGENQHFSGERVTNIKRRTVKTSTYSQKSHILKKASPQIGRGSN
ncbi:hypothetical protein ABE65_018670 [Fictibacillus phosphorivorans]|uniref:Uncharacterized protein n=1 Tax=Fictibacillus phosphorivorans TaxID=1221500 RepID=A0A160IQH4_9BACL|nr:hypothetical protein ABE65_018670 [Fictibacillus phosphorivorans]